LDADTDYFYFGPVMLHLRPETTAWDVMQSLARIWKDCDVLDDVDLVRLQYDSANARFNVTLFCPHGKVLTPDQADRLPWGATRA
jgi:hypothetical protein